MRSSFFNVWSSREGSALANALFLALAPFALAATLLLLAPRTFLLEGVGPHPGWPLALIAMGALILAVPASVPIPFAGAVWRAAPLLLLLVPVAPEPHRIALVALAAAGGLAWARGAWAQRLASLLVATSLAWLACVLASGIVSHLEARVEGFGLLGIPLLGGLKLLGAEAHWADGFLFVTTHGVTERVLPSPDKFGGAFPVCLLAALGTLGVLFRWPARTLAGVCLLVVAYALGRTAWLLGASLEAGSVPLPWWDEKLIVGSYLPLALLLALVLGRAAVAATAPPPDIRGRPWRLGLAFAGALCLGLGWYWVDPGRAKTGTVLIDERYSRWEWSEDPIDTERYGVKTVYSYYNLAEALGHYFPVARNFEDLSDEILADVSVLVLKTPTEPYPAEVLEAIWRFVERGGGLWLIGDHTNVFGMDSNLNLVSSKRYGVVFRDDAVIDPVANRQLYRPARDAHPIVRRMPLFLWMTGDSLRAPWGCREVILTPRLLSDRPDYSQNTGFGDFKAQLDERVGSMVQAVALHEGAGRVAVWSDSTVFSNFAIFLPGKMELALGYVDWLNRANSAFPARAVLLVAGLLLLVPMLCRTRAAEAALGVWSGFALSAAVAPAIYSAGYPPLEAAESFEYVAFVELNERTYHLPLLTTLDEPTPDGYLTAFVAAQRVGKRPFVARSIEEIGQAETVVIAHGGHRSWSAEEIERLLGHARDGGWLILLDVSTNGQTLFEEIAEQTGFALKPFEFSPPEELADLFASLQKRNRQNPASRATVPRGPVLTDAAKSALGPGQVALTIEGGEAAVVLADEPQGVVAALVPYGSGMIVVTTTRSLFSDASLGENSNVPDQRQLALLKWLFRWYRHEPPEAVQHEAEVGREREAAPVSAPTEADEP